jgi:hypothetical protein
VSRPGSHRRTPVCLRDFSGWARPNVAGAERGNAVPRLAQATGRCRRGRCRVMGIRSSGGGPSLVANRRSGRRRRRVSLGSYAQQSDRRPHLVDRPIIGSLLFEKPFEQPRDRAAGRRWKRLAPTNGTPHLLLPGADAIEVQRTSGRGLHRPDARPVDARARPQTTAARRPKRVMRSRPDHRRKPRARDSHANFAQAVILPLGRLLAETRRRFWGRGRPVCEPRRAGRARAESDARGDAASELTTVLAPAAAPA